MVIDLLMNARSTIQLNQVLSENLGGFAFLSAFGSFALCTARVAAEGIKKADLLVIY
jgi:hypothetical protein